MIGCVLKLEYLINAKRQMDPSPKCYPVSLQEPHQVPPNPGMKKTQEDLLVVPVLNASFLYPPPQ